MKISPWNIISSQLAQTPQVPREDLSGQTVIVVGIARETKCETAEMWLLDLGSFDSVNAFVDRAESELPRVDLLIENAGVLPTETLDGTQDGWETAFQVNNLSTSLLALLLLPRMIKTAQEFNTKPRIVVVSSEVHYFAKLQDKLHTHVLLVLNVLFVRSLAERIKDKPVIVDTVNPGYCLSNLRKGLRGFRAAMDWMMEKLIARTSEEGARQVVWAAIGGKDKEDKLRGGYISQMDVQEPSDFVLSTVGKTFQEKIWVGMISELCAVNPKLEPIVKEFPSKPVGETGAVKEPEVTRTRKTSTTSPALDEAMKARSTVAPDKVEPQSEDRKVDVVDKPEETPAAVETVESKVAQEGQE
ncbi:hypothetical protein CVT24_012780 [Panaeolus cyanescens]|uniref:Uncharacterized protein n=1 Tax=Panaeolus cyanescens TaxID=181874 RepID=A0A409W614_9AGAR|nr:hypothetical protein CVT24_012780 [Panaeolus cyanescens]